MGFFQKIFGSEKIKSRCLAVFSLSLLALALVPLLVLAVYNHPVCWDDFKAFAELLKSPAKISFGQRFSSQFNNAFFYPSMENFSFGTMMKILVNHRIFSYIYIILFVASFFFLMRELNRNIIKAPKNIFLGIFSASLFLLLNFTNLSSTLFYCHPATSGYTGGVVFSFLFLGLLIRVHFSKGGKEKIISTVLLFVTTFILSGFIEIFVLFAGFISFYAFLFIKRSESGKRNPVFFFVFMFSLLIFVSFFAVNKGMISAKYSQKKSVAAKTELFFHGMTHSRMAHSRWKIQSMTVRAILASAQKSSQPALATAKKHESDMAILIGNLIPWSKYNFKFLKQEIKKVLSFHNLPILIFIFYLLEKTELRKSSYTAKKLICLAALYPVILLMSLSGCYSGLCWFTLYVTVRNVFDIIFIMITVLFLYSCLKFTQRFVSATFRLELIPCSFDFTKLACFFVLAASIFFTSLVSDKYLVGAAWNDVLSGAAKKYDRIQIENYKTILESKEENVTVKYPGFPKALVNFQGNYILFDPESRTLFASKDVVSFFGKREIIYEYEDFPSETDLYTRGKRY
ncbi:MAG: hypothetical protein IJP61_02285 [Treponema sp.]|nr:hypothetical protein [Treponema sp.]